MQNKQKLLYGVIMDFRLCQNLSTLGQVKSLAHLFADEGFYPSPAKGGEPKYKASNIDTLIEERYTECDPNEKGLAGLLRSIHFPLIVDDSLAGEVSSSFGWSVFKGERIGFAVGANVWAYPEEQSVYQEPLAQHVLALARKLYPIVQPAYVSITDPDFDSQPMNDAQVSKLKITTLSWVNMFDINFVNKYGKNVLLNIPGFDAQELVDGGVMFQSRPGIIVESHSEHDRWQKEAVAYLANHGQRLHFGGYR